VDMNGLLSGLASAQGNSGGGGQGCGNNNNGIFGGGIIWIIVLLFLVGGIGQGQNNGTVCGCDPKHCKELCRCGSNNNSGLCGLGGLGGLGSGNGCLWIILLLIVCFCGNQNKPCKNHCDEE
jgi:hypothetical protein